VTVVREAAETTALREMNSQKEQFRRLAIMADWDSKENTYRTLGMFFIFCAIISCAHGTFYKTVIMKYANCAYFRKWSPMV